MIDDVPCLFALTWLPWTKNHFQNGKHKAIHQNSKQRITRATGNWNGKNSQKTKWAAPSRESLVTQTQNLSPDKKFRQRCLTTRHHLKKNEKKQISEMTVLVRVVVMVGLVGGGSAKKLWEVNTCANLHEGWVLLSDHCFSESSLLTLSHQCFCQSVGTWIPFQLLWFFVLTAPLLSLFFLPLS